jgi:hypothetical protein
VLKFDGFEEGMGKRNKENIGIFVKLLEKSIKSSSKILLKKEYGNEELFDGSRQRFCIEQYIEHKRSKRVNAWGKIMMN